MSADATTCEAEVRVGERRTAGADPGCPVCGGGVVPTRGAWRCVRCGFVICAGCEPTLACGDYSHADEG